MKKPVSLFIITLFIFSILLLPGCSAKSPVADQSTPAVSEVNDDPMNLTFIGASTTGPIFMLMSGLSECVNKSYPDSTVTIVPGSFGTNVTRINNNEADAAVTDTSFVIAASAGKEPFKEKMDNISSVAFLYPGMLQIIAAEDVGIESLDQFIENKMKLRLSIGLAGGSSDVLFQQLLAEYGVTVDDVNEWGGEILFQNIDDSVQMLLDGRIDGLVLKTFYPTPNVQELAKNKEVVLLKIAPEIIKSVCSKYNYQETVIPAKTYDFIKEDTPYINSNSIFIVPKNSSDEQVYKITKSIHENLEYLQAVHISLSKLEAEMLVKNLGIPLHPGAEKYYREIGVIK